MKWIILAIATSTTMLFRVSFQIASIFHCADYYNTNLDLPKNTFDPIKQKHSLKFIHVTETGGKTIEEIGRTFGFKWGEYHEEYGHQHKLFTSQDKDLIEKYDWFVVARNPFDRLISEFHCALGGVGKSAHMFNVTQFNWYIREKIRAPETVKIGAFGGYYIPQSRYITPLLMNPHFGMSSRPYKSILRFEHLGEDFDQLMKGMGLDPRFADRKLIETEGQKRYFSALDFDSETLRLILNIYDEDFKILNYSRNPAHSESAIGVKRTPAPIKNVEDYKIFIRTPQNVSPDELFSCFKERYNRTIFEDNGEKIRVKENKNIFLRTYMPQDLSDLYLWRVSRRWRTTTDLAEADIALLLNFPVISEYAGLCNGMSHTDRQKSVIDWASENLPNSTTAAIVCPSFVGCDGNEINEKFGSNVKILMKERNPKWLRSTTDRDNHILPGPLLTEMVNDFKRTIIIPYTAHSGLNRWNSRLLEVPDEVPFDAPLRCNYSDVSAPWCDGTGRGEKQWKQKNEVFFIGDTRGEPVREAIQMLEQRENITIAYTHLIPSLAKKKNLSKVDNYASQMMQARFCLCPRGDTPTARRLFDSIVAGCLPIVIADDIDNSLPFPEVIPYNSFWFRVKEAEWIRDPNAVLDRIEAIPEEEIGSRLRNMETYASLLDWMNTADDIGFRTIIEEIMKVDRI